MAFRFLRKMVFYGMIMGIPYLIGYCNGYEDSKYKKEGLEKVWVENKEKTLDALEGMTDSAYETLKDVIKDSRGEENELSNK